MAVFCISYDLNKSGQNYDGLKEAIKQTGWAHILDSTWLVSTAETAEQLSKRLLAQMDQNDSLFISKVHAGEYAGWLKEEFWEWVRKHV